jgi:hypothetical protein
MPTERDLFDSMFLKASAPIQPSEFVREIMVLGLFNFNKWNHVLAWEEKNA